MGKGCCACHCPPGYTARLGNEATMRQKTRHEKLITGRSSFPSSSPIQRNKGREHYDAEKVKHQLASVSIEMIAFADAVLV